MSNKSKIEFVSNYKKVISVDILHDFFNDGFIKYIDIKPTTDSLTKMKNYGLIFRKKNAGFVILSENDKRVKGSVFNGSIVLVFKLLFLDKYFLNYTDIEFQNYNLSPVKIEVEKEVGEIKKYIKLTLIGNWTSLKNIQGI
mgnify:CR=1 FL=1